MPLPRAFQQVDVFSAVPYQGNALAVVLDAQGLSDAAMQRFAAWTNLAETTFLLPPTPEAAAAGADYQVRIFTTAYEMPFAGHPTLGSCHAWLTNGGVPKNTDCVVQQCKVGLVRIRREEQPAPTKIRTPQLHATQVAHTRLAFAAPPLKRAAIATELLPALLAALGLQANQLVASQHLVNGPSYCGLLLDSADSVLAIKPDGVALKAVLAQAGCTGVGVAALRQDLAETAEEPTSGLIRRSNREARAFAGGGPAYTAPAPSQTGAQQEAPEQPSLDVRMFVSDLVVAEDPITGSFNASLAQWLIADGHMPASYVAAQGQCIGRDGRVYIEQDGSGQVWVGGDSVTYIAGSVTL